MSAKQIAKRSLIAAFIRVVNYNHLMPTRYALDVGETVKSTLEITAFTQPFVSADKPEARHTLKENIAKEFQQRYNAGRNRSFFSPLRF